MRLSATRVTCVVVQFGFRAQPVKREIPFDFAQCRLSLRREGGSTRMSKLAGSASPHHYHYLDGIVGVGALINSRSRRERIAANE